MPKSCFCCVFLSRHFIGPHLCGFSFAIFLIFTSCLRFCLCLCLCFLPGGVTVRLPLLHLPLHFGGQPFRSNTRYGGFCVMTGGFSAYHIFHLGFSLRLPLLHLPLHFGGQPFRSNTRYRGVLCHDRGIFSIPHFSFRV